MNNCAAVLLDRVTAASMGFARLQNIIFGVFYNTETLQAPVIVQCLFDTDERAVCSTETL